MTTLTTPQRHKRVAAEVRAVMGRQGYKQKDLARALDISEAAASELVRGRTPFSLDKLDAVATWLNVRITDLLGDVAADGTERRLMTGWRSRRHLIGLKRPIATQFQTAA